MKVRIFAKNNNTCKEFEKLLTVKLLSNGHEVVKTSPDLCISIGGDGTFLYMIHEMGFKTDIKYAGFNLGTLGFLTSFSATDLDKFIDKLNDEFYIDEYTFEDVTVKNQSGEHKYKSLNEVVVRNYINKSSRLDVYCNNELIENFIGDAVVVSTSVGSSAYNLNLGGPLIYDKEPCLILSSIAPINNRVYSSFRNSIVFTKDKEITIIPEKDFNINLLLDGHEKNLKNVSNIKVKLCKKTIKVLRFNKVSYSTLIKEKLL